MFNFSEIWLLFFLMLELFWVKKYLGLWEGFAHGVVVVILIILLFFQRTY